MIRRTLFALVLAAASCTAAHASPLPPTVTGLSPTSGPMAGGTSVVVSGTNFRRVGAVFFGTTAATSYTVASPTSLTAVSPAEAMGVVDVRVHTTAGTSAIVPADQFTFTTGPICPQGSTFVAAGSNLHTAIEDGLAKTYCLAAATFEIGTTSLLPDDGDVIVGQPVTFGPNGEVFATSIIHGTASDAIVRGTNAPTNFTLDSVDICCSPDTMPGTDRGRGVQALATDHFTIRNSRVHGNGQVGLVADYGMNIDHTEIDHNGGGTLDFDAGIKTIHFYVITNSYVHDNNGQGLWSDCDTPGARIQNTRVSANHRSGIFIEISSGDSGAWNPTIPAGESYGFLVTGNTVTGNETDNATGTGGIHVVSSRNVTIDSNVTTDNLVQEMYLHNDTRSGNGHNGCSSGFPLSNVVVSNNSYGPLLINGCDIVGVTCTNNTKIK